MRETFKFGEALDKMNEGYRVARSSWNGSSWVKYVPKAGIYDAYFLRMTMYGTYTDYHMAVWMPSVDDLLADDWITVGYQDISEAKL